MAYSDLREFISTLERQGELKRIDAEVDPNLEIAEIADRSVKRGGPALLFERPKGSSMPVLINSLASLSKMQLAFEVDSLDDIAARISEYLDLGVPKGVAGKLKGLAKLAEVRNFLPKTVRSGQCQQIVKSDGFSLRDYPVLTCWPGRWRALHHPAHGFLAQSDHRQAQLWNVPPAGLRRAHHRDALADAQTGRRALPPAATRRAPKPGWTLPWRSAQTPRR